MYKHPSDNEDMDFDDGEGDSNESCPSKASNSKPAMVKQEPVWFKYNCENCMFATDDKMGFSAHLASHLQLKPFACMFCQKTFVKQSGLTKHIGLCEEAQRQMGAKQQQQQQASSSSDSHQTAVPPPPPAMFECSVTTCGKVFSTQDKYREHFKTMDVDPLGDGVFYCEVCIIRMFTKAGFPTHMNVAHIDGFFREGWVNICGTLVWFEALCTC